MNKLEKAMKQTAKKLVSGMIAQELLGWPPGCSGIWYQPERPIMPTQDTAPTEKPEQE